MCIDCSKEAQVCYCGSDNCRGYIGGEKTSQPLKQVVDNKTTGASSKKKKEDKKKDYNFTDDMVWLHCAHDCDHQ